MRLLFANPHGHLFVSVCSRCSLSSTSALTMRCPTQSVRSERDVADCQDVFGRSQRCRTHVWTEFRAAHRQDDHGGCKRRLVLYMAEPRRLRLVHFVPAPRVLIRPQSFPSCRRIWVPFGSKSFWVSLFLSLPLSLLLCPITTTVSQPFEAISSFFDYRHSIFVLLPCKSNSSLEERQAWTVCERVLHRNC